MRVWAPEIVGRQAEMATLLAGLRIARQQGKAMFLVGDAGMGKTRLAKECAAEAAAGGYAVLRGRTGGVGVPMPFRPLVEAVSRHVREHEATGSFPPDAYRPALARLVPQWRQAGAAVAPRPEALVELSEALLHLLSSIGAGPGCLLLLEDLHDADPETLAVIEYLIDNLGDRPIMLVTTMRPGSRASELVSAGERRAEATVLDIRPLDEQWVRVMAAACLGLDPGGLPSHVTDYLVRASDGNPYLIEVLVSNLIDTGLLRRDADGWRMPGHLEPPVPDIVIRGHERRLNRLDRHTRNVLLTAAVLGERFDIAELKAATGDDDASTINALRAAADFVEPDRHSRAGYVFRHSLTTEALIATLHPAEHAVIARSAAAALCDDDPHLEGERCHLVARLLDAANETAAAARLYAMAGRRALESGAVGSAITILRHAAQAAAPADRPSIVAAYIQALADDGQLDAALQTLRSQPDDILADIDTSQEIALRTRLAWTAVSMGRNDEAEVQIAQWRQRFGAIASEGEAAGLMVVQAHLTLLGGQDGGAERVRQAKSLAVDAAAVAEQANLPEVACQAWQVLGLATRREEFEEAARCHQQMLAVAERHDLLLWRADALLRLAGNHFMRTGSPDRLREARDLACGLGAQVLRINAEGALAMAHVLGTDHEAAMEIVDRWRGPAARMKLRDAEGYLLLTSAVSAAHQGRRREMSRLLESFQRIAGDGSYMIPLALGLGRAFCALLEENRDLALEELARVYEWEERHPAVYCTTGRFGLGLLLDAIHHRLPADQHRALSRSPAANLHWNQQFALLAEAVLCGRDGHRQRAAELVPQASLAGAGFPTAWHLGLRLVSEAAIADGWGDPAQWLGRAEDYFQQAAIASVASACRSLLRGTGARTRQRRQGIDHVPAPLRRRGVTVREYEVLTVMPDRPSNQQLARRLFISPRTAEKHVASLIVKLGVADRHQLCQLSSESQATAVAGDESGAA